MNRIIPCFILLSLLSACTPSSTSTTTTAANTGTTSIPGDDPLASYAWHLQNNGQSTFSSSAGTAGEDFNILEVHNQDIKGSGIKIAISDSGVDVDHPDLINTQLFNEHRNYSSDSSSTWRNGSPYPIEHEAHGTAVAGLASAEEDNSIGSRGVAPLAKYAGFLFIGNFHNSSSSYEAKTLDQMMGNFDVFNYSYGYVGCEFIPADASVINAYKSGVTTLRSGKGAIYVKAAGNDYIGSNSDCENGATSYFIGNTNTSEDQNLPYLIVTGAVNAKGKISSYSTPGSGLWVTSAGGEYGTTSPAMLTTDIQGCGYGMGSSSLNSNCDYTSTMNGTSSAAPVLSGVIALILEANPTLTWRDVKHILSKTSDPINYSTAAIAHPGGTSWALSGYTYDYLYVRNAANYDFSNTYGFGRVNAEKAVNMAKGYVSELGSYVETDWSTFTSGTLNLAIPDKSTTGVSSTINVSRSLVIESIQIRVSTNHVFLGDIGIELKSPSGTVSRILHVNSNIDQSGLSDFIMLSNAFYGENSSGPWTIKLIDGGAQDTGSLTNWKIKINGHDP